MGHGDRTLTIDVYLDQLDGRLRGPRAWRRRVLDEIRDGLLCEVEGGCSEPEAVSRWGSVGLVAAELNECGRIARCRRMARMVLRGVPFLAVGWFLAVVLSPDPWAAEPGLIRWVAPALFASVAATVAGSVWLLRRAPTARRPMDGVAGVATGVVLAVLCLCVLLVYRLDASHGHMYWPAVCFSGTMTTGLLIGVFSEARRLMTEMRTPIEG
ncbi:hypothetical protein [Streptomyces sp. NPDC021562]|uniref:hypothetical protein n=1 Tax=Streptomyces sp. NPDC021562 TaxID=3155121 RepID=UPI0010D63B10